MEVQESKSSKVDSSSVDCIVCVDGKRLPLLPHSQLKIVKSLVDTQ